MAEDYFNQTDNESVDSKRQFARRGRLSQFMVLINGLILTVTAFATFIIFLDQIKETRLKSLHTSLINELEKELSNIGQDLFLAQVNPENINKDKYQRIIKLEQNASSQWSLSPVVGDNPESSIVKNYVSYALPRMKGNNFVLGSDEGETITYASQKISDNSFMLAQLDNNYLYNILENSEDYASLRRLKIFEDKDGRKLFDFSRDNLQEIAAENVEHHIAVIDFKGNQLSFAIDMVRDPYFDFISKLPYLLLLFGATLTIVGTLYVRNNHKQAIQLEVMNKILEDKNGALQSKIEESHDLYRELSRKEKEYETVLNALDGVLFEVDLTGDIRFTNAAWTKITHNEVEDVLERDLFSFFAKEDERKMRELFSAFIQDPKPNHFATRIHKQDGGYRSVEVTFSVMHEDQHGQKRVIGTITDTEDRLKAERALDEVEKRYRTIVENAAGGIYQVSLEGKVMSANPSLANILGYDSVDDLINDNFNIRTVFVSDDETAIFDKAMNTDGFIRNHEVQIRRANGEIIWVNENARAVKGMDGSILYYEGSLEDITQRKQSEIELRVAKLNSDLASRAKSEFLANMSHELRTPLNSIIGFSEIIKSEALGEIEQKPYVDYAKDIYTSGTRLLSVINEILGISKIEAGERQLNESVVDLRSVTQVCIDLMASKIESNQIDVTNIISDDLPGIIGEEMAFKQMIMNLLSNAIKFTPQDGKITISTDYSAGGAILLSITDTGIGIDESDIPKALSPFGQLDNALSRSNSGTGLGLTLVDSLIRLHDGRLEMLSQKGIGTTVTLKIPAKRVAVKRADSDKNQSADNVTSLSNYKKT